jgi:hypothetical protein
MNRTILLAFAGIFATTANVYAAPPDITLSADKRIVTLNSASTTFTPPPSKSGLTTIYSNLATLDPKGVYMAGTGYAIGGPASPIGQAWYAAPFTPASNASADEIDVAAGDLNGINETVTVTLYADASGLPGQELWSHNATVTPAGGCCGLVAVSVKGGVPLTAGTQYWVGLTTPSSGTGTFAAWFFNVADQVDTGLAVENLGSGWFSQPLLPNVAFGVYSK